MRARWIVLTAVVAWSGCGGADASSDLGSALDLSVADVGDGGAGADLGVAADLGIAADLAAGGADDLAVPRDLAAVGPADFAFGLNPDGAVACSPSATPTTLRFVWNAITAPMNRTQLAFDLNGDGLADNQLGNIVGNFASDGLDSQALIADAIAAGTSITLLEARSSDAAFTADVCAATDVLAGLAMTSPDYSGGGHFTVDGTVVPGHFFGPIAAAQFTSEPSPADAEMPTVVRVPLPLFGAVPVHVFAAHVVWTRAANGRITGGQLNGAIRPHEIDTELVPGVTAVLNQLVTADPSSQTSMEVRAIFDNGGAADPACAAGTCKNPDGSCAIHGDNKIDRCEVTTEPVMKAVLTPDVQMFDAAGHYHPSAANTHKDSLSIGIGFTAVPATF